MSTQSVEKRRDLITALRKFQDADLSCRINQINAFRKNGIQSMLAGLSTTYAESSHRPSFRALKNTLKFFTVSSLLSLAAFPSPECPPTGPSPMREFLHRNVPDLPSTKLSRRDCEKAVNQLRSLTVISIFLPDEAPFLALVPEVKSLEVRSQKPIGDLFRGKVLPNLVSLFVFAPFSLGDLSRLPNAGRLESLGLAGTEAPGPKSVVDLSQAAKLGHLRHLTIFHAFIQNIKGIEEFPSLETVGFKDILLDGSVDWKRLPALISKRIE